VQESPEASGQQQANPFSRREKPPIRLRGVNQNNLKDVSVQFPARKLSVVTGLSGSGKSSLAFDTLYAEGQRRYIESLSTYTRQFLEKMPKPKVEHVENIPPAIALEQRNHVVNSRSTVGSQTEVVDYLRLLFAKVGQTECMNCGDKVVNIDTESILREAESWFVDRKGAITAPLLKPPTVEEAKTRAKKKSKAKKKKKAATKKPVNVSPESFFQTLREQGFRRILWKKTAKTILELDLDDLGTPDFPKILKREMLPDTFWLVVDRFRLRGEVDGETRSRMLDSIDQALVVGNDELAFFDYEKKGWKAFEKKYACVDCGTVHQIPEPNLFSFNSPLGACEACSGFGYTLDIAEDRVVPDPSRTLLDGAIDPFSKPAYSEWQKAFFRFAERHGISIGKRYRELTQSQKDLIWYGHEKDTKFPGILGFFDKLSTKKYKLHVRVFIRRYQAQSVCETCGGTRLKPAALAVKVGGASIADVLGQPIEDAHRWAEGLKLSEFDSSVSKELLLQVNRRLHFLIAVGVGYLTSDRLTKTLSGGEFQRINLATQLGNGLVGTLYVLDEPSIGLHAADTERLIGVLNDLRDHGNTVVVVEHDLDIIKQADWLVELGPQSGRKGGELMVEGPPQKLAETPGSVTGKYLSGDFEIGRVRAERSEPRKFLKIEGCTEHNLQNVTANLPLERFVVVTGVSGSGKSTLVHKTLYPALADIFGTAGTKGAIEKDSPGAYRRLYGAEQVSGVVLLDQKPIGKNSRSNPATYLKAWDDIRKAFANQVLALRRGYTPQYFSFNVDGGRCPVCKGEGEITIDMHFMAEVKLPCEECNGTRFKREILDVKYRGKNVSQVLNMTIDEAYDLFRDHAHLVRKFSILREVGLGYLQVGQPAPTLSGGESQRLKIASALDDRDKSRQLYLFDEPTTGLHHDDIRKLLEVAHDLVDFGQSIIMVEHHLDVIAQADWVIDMGPGGGENGGQIVAAGRPEELARNENSMTGQMLVKGGFFPSGRA
jgi:excinuclease ABC subunit A